MSAERSAVLQTLAQRIQEIEASSHVRRRSAQPLGIAVLDGLFPEGRLPAGSLVELIAAAAGAGTWTLALLLAKQVCGERAMVIVDGSRGFYPPAAARWGIDLVRSIVVRPRTPRDLFLALNQSLRCPAVGAVVGSCDPLRSLDARRLQLSAEAGGGAGFLLRRREALRAPSFAQLRLLVSPLATVDTARRVRVEVVRCHGGKNGSCLQLEIDDETGHVRVLPEMADPAASTRPARASG